MAIGLARAEPIQRSRGHSIAQRLAYINRAKVKSARTGEVFDFADQPAPLSVATLLPLKAADIASDMLCNAIETASSRKDAALGFELMLSLPMPNEFGMEESWNMAQSFVRSVIVDKHQLPVVMALHDADANFVEPPELLVGDEDGFASAIDRAAANLHCHVLVSPRQLHAEGLSKRRYTALDPVTRNGKTFGRNWGRLWGLFQNDYFLSQGSTLRVTPNPPVPLTTVPLKLVRGWRRTRSKAEPGIEKRKLLVNASREAENRDAVADVARAVSSFTAPVTRRELEAFFARHLPHSLASESTDVAIGMQDCIEIQVPQSKDRWYASVDLVSQELAAFGRALMLSDRSCGGRDVRRHVRQGYAAETRALLIDLFSGPDLVMVETNEDPKNLKTDLAQLARLVDLVPISIATPAGHATPNSTVVDVSSLPRRMISEALIIVDDPDALHAAELNLLMAAAVAGNNKLVLSRRSDSDWPRLALLDLIAEHVQVHSLGLRAPVFTTGTQAADTVSAPRTAIVFSLERDRSAPSIVDWPRFCVDPFGMVTASPRAIASTIELLATYPDDLSWHYPGNNQKGDAARLRSTLNNWLHSEAFHRDAAPAHDLDAEHSPLEALDLDDNEDDITEDFAVEEDLDFERDWTDEAGWDDQPDFDDTP